MSSPSTSSQFQDFWHASSHLHPDIWTLANSRLVAKSITEFTHERLLTPVALHEEDSWQHFQLTSPDDKCVYQFKARLLSLEHWHLDRGSLRRYREGLPVPLDILDFIIEFQALLGLPATRLADYLEEISGTLYSLAYKLTHRDPPAAELALADFQTVESCLTEGHPIFIANNARGGFNGIDHHAYAPEAAAPIHPVWLAVETEHTVLATMPDLTYETLLEGELGKDVLQAFHERLIQLGLEPSRYRLMPIHPWQWLNKIVIAYAAELAMQRIVYLGVAPDDYQAQQSIRTLFNRTRPERPYVKTALSIVNMGFVRGLSPYYMSTAPAINAWLQDLIAREPQLQAMGFSILCEIAAIGYRNRYYEAASKGVPQQKMLAALWRESPLPRLRPRQRLISMAALLHQDSRGALLIDTLFEASKLQPEQWLKRYLHAYLSPLLHCFYAYDLVFMPHGENVILILEQHAPVGIFMKDIAEEIAVLDPQAKLPPEISRIAVEVPEQLKALSLLTDVFDCFFRHLSALLDQFSSVPQQAFWQLVADCIHAYQKAHPQYAEKYGRYDLFAAKFDLSCLNRLQLRNQRQMVDLADPAGSLQITGLLPNPIADYRDPISTT